MRAVGRRLKVASTALQDVPSQDQCGSTPFGSPSQFAIRMPSFSDSAPRRAKGGLRSASDCVVRVGCSDEIEFGGSWVLCLDIRVQRALIGHVQLFVQRVCCRAGKQLVGT